jgi:hypothetical protein
MKKIGLLALSVLLVAATSASAVTKPLGARIGYTSDEIDQFHLGGHIRLFELARNVAVQPSLEIGFGDDATLIAVNGDVFYEFTELETPEWSFYAGGGLVFSYVNFDVPEGIDVDDDDTNLGLDIAGGARYQISPGARLFTEIRIGLEDAPDFKITAGVTFF